MFITLAEFDSQWHHESASTLKLLRALTDASLKQAVSPMDRTLGRIAWHIVVTVPEMMNRTGLTVLGPPEDAAVPSAARVIADSYERASASLLEQLRSHWTDATLQIVDDMYGQKWKRGLTLFALITHQIHHRGQMTVLMRQAGLTVPGLYGPAREEWSAFGMAAPTL
ncbi:MAG TPA: DinB family protein [Vicinamibacteria bacterium]|jgi:uncharacterized damage-inducible protein DinB|nr:DinB family protein [Vicinamibacteria bacterium]